uniref:Uncharacterized protein n=1 Tax=Ralstonia syzygii R24 TaxID=907261 RepID=G3A3U0_9RALS|nr:hypothetical protein RALSY_30296 [Ralstonia syzygii R24]
MAPHISIVFLSVNIVIPYQYQRRISTLDHP